MVITLSPCTDEGGREEGNIKASLIPGTPEPDCPSRSMGEVDSVRLRRPSKDAVLGSNVDIKFGLLLLSATTGEGVLRSIAGGLTEGDE